MFALIFVTGASAQFLSTGASWVPQQSWQSSYSNLQPNSYNMMQSAASTGASYAPMQSAASASAFVARPSYSYNMMQSAASTGASYAPMQSAASASAFVARPSYSYNMMQSAASTGESYASMQSAASASAFVARPSYSYNMMQSAASTGASYATYSPMTSAASTGAYVQQPYIQQASISSENNPYNVKALGVGKLIGRTATKNMGVAQQMMLGEKHVVGNDLKVLENHEADKTIFTKKVVHHSPVLHKTIRTHEIAEDTVHDKLVHHMNTVKDQFRKVPGNNYMGGEQHVDHTTAIEAAPQVVAQQIAQPQYKQFSKFNIGCSCRGQAACSC